MSGNNRSGGTRDDVNRPARRPGAGGGRRGPERAGSRGERITAERYGERIARPARRRLSAVPYEARALSASLGEADDAPGVLTGV
ncbi:hypothetical protein [Streptomyces goshikiensis]|uniref:hypothetical protein n=1 Tax=Streptomyces goshikiensis TaxID=1942 RepID=UPI0036A7DA40